MERRTFLKLAGLGATAAAVPATAIAALARLHELSAAQQAPGAASAQANAPAYTAALGGTMYRGQGGLVSVSSDGGQSWVRHSNFGPDVSVAALGVAGRTIRMTMRLGTREFRLALAEGGHLWHTA